MDELRIELLGGFCVTSGVRAVPDETWRAPYPDHEEEFVHAWMEFAHWASDMPGAGLLSLTRDIRDPGRFVSFGAWESLEQVHDWKGSPEFRERMAQVLQHVAEFQPSELELVATAQATAH